MNKTWERPKIPEKERKNVEAVHNGQLHMKGTAWEQIFVQEEWIDLAALILQTQNRHHSVVLVAALSKQTFHISGPQIALKPPSQPQVSLS